MDHKAMGIECFNKTWDFIDNKCRTGEETLEMIHTAHASAYHWRQVGTPLNFARSEWQVSHVYSIAGLGESALYHGKLSLELCLENSIGGLDLAFAYEACARACAVCGDFDSSAGYREQALKASADIAKQEDRDYIVSELETIPGRA